MLTILEGFLEGLNISCSRLDGDTARVVRESVIESFNRQGESSETSTRVFLLSTRAGGVGINLQVADTVILYDSDWNPQMDSQAIARSHRIGQNKKVLVLRLVSCNRTSSNDDDNDNGSDGDGGDGTKI
jgi:SNF2 family DNA or RNA helicase